MWKSANFGAVDCLKHLLGHYARLDRTSVATAVGSELFHLVEGTVRSAIRTKDEGLMSVTTKTQPLKLFPPIDYYYDRF